MIDEDTYTDYQQCFLRIGDYAKSIGCTVTYLSPEKCCAISFNGMIIALIRYNDNDIWEQYSSILEREQYSVDSLPYKYIPYTWYEKFCETVANVFRRNKNNVFFHKKRSIGHMLIPNHYNFACKDKLVGDGNGYYISEDHLKQMIKFFITTNLANYKKYLNQLKINELQKDFEYEPKNN